MKKLKIKKRMTSFLMLAVMVVSIIGVIPKTIAYANDDVEIKDYTFGICSADNPDTDMSLEKFSVQESAWRNIAFVNVEKGQYVVASIVKGVSIDNTIYKYRYLSKGDSTYLHDESSFRGVIENYTYNNTDYCFVVRYGTYNPSSFVFKVNKAMCFTTTENVASAPSVWIRDFIGDALPTTFTQVSDDGMDSSKIPNGSQDNPYEDKDIGTIILKSHAFIPVKNNTAYPLLPQTDDSTFAYYRFKYQDKTSSGFSISNNKYARTFIQVRVQNQCVLLDPNDRNVVKEFYKHYGEFYQYKNIPTENISDNIFKVSWDDITLKWSDFTEHPNSTNKKLAYRFMIRVICTDSLTVVPDEKSGWHAGGWRSIVFDGSKFVEETNGHVTDDGTWTDDKDDGHNNSSDKTTDVPKTEDEANDSMNDSSSNSSTNFVDKLKQAKNAFDTANEYIKQVLKVPTMLGKLFSFFPDWVLYPFEFAFALIPWIIIYKLLRG